MPINQIEYENEHLNRLLSYEAEINTLYLDVIQKAAYLSVLIKNIPDTPFKFKDNPIVSEKIKELLKVFNKEIYTTVYNGIKLEWDYANNKNTAIVESFIGNNKKDYKKFFNNNLAARDAFLNRKVNGLNLSDRIWKQGLQFKKELEMALDLGIREGKSAQQIASDLKQYLYEPNNLFRRYRDKHGNLQLSKNAKAYKPGRGYYRSSYKNAKRLAVTETNIAYRSAEYERFQQLDFIEGIEIKLSNNHTLNGKAFTDICDTLKGKYPKEFKFTGWHPQCRCYQIPILQSKKDFIEGKKINSIKDTPNQFNNWLKNNTERINSAKHLPYFIKDNYSYVGNIITPITSSQIKSIILKSDPTGIMTFIELVSAFKTKKSIKFRKKAFENILQNEVYTKDGIVFKMQGCIVNKTELHSAKKLETLNKYVIFPGKDQLKQIKKLEKKKDSRIADIYMIDKKTFYLTKVDIKTVHSGSEITIKQHLLSGSGQASTIVLDITGGTKRHQLISGMRAGWNKNLKTVLLYWKGGWKKIDKELLFSNNIYAQIK